MPTKPVKPRGPVFKFLQMLVDLLFFALLMVGVAGVMFKLMAPDGWIREWLHDIFGVNPGYWPVLAGAVLIGGLLGKRWLEGFNMKTSLGDMIMYAWMLLGLGFGIRYLITGSF